MTPSDSTALFVYGTLMVPEVLRALLGRVPVQREAILKGYRRYVIEGECYPAIISDASADVRGRLLTGLSPTEVETLDTYEGDSYVRCQVVLEVDGAPTAADCYVWRSASEMRLGRDDWNIDTFVTEHLERTLRALT